MREIKFRAWDKTTQQLYEVVRLDWESGEVYLRDDKNDYGFGVPWDDRITLMQYTGLKDKNGVGIYEGDVVRRVGGGLLGSPDEILFTGEVIFTNSGYKAKYLYDEPGTAGKHRHEAYGNLFNKSELEVIGNIYENPELSKDSHVNQ